MKLQCRINNIKKWQTSLINDSWSLWLRNTRLRLNMQPFPQRECERELPRLWFSLTQGLEVRVKAIARRKHGERWVKKDNGKRARMNLQDVVIVEVMNDVLRLMLVVVVVVGLVVVVVVG